jgi:glycosyltransferase involved in cell wall biosynthesis
MSDGLSISICIATHEREKLLHSTLEKIAGQTRPPDEIVISDSSRQCKTEQLVAAFQQTMDSLPVKYVKSDRKALPWQRWNGFQASNGDIIYFMDDDISLAPDALQVLEKTYHELFASFGREAVAGVGFYTFLDDGSEKIRHPQSFEERWLHISSLPSGTITPGGLGVPPSGLSKNTTVEIGRLIGGRMSFRREILQQIGLLEELAALYDAGLGRGEDTVLSYYAAKAGKLFMITFPLAAHLRDERATKTAFATDGWKKGMAETWGRAHTMRWMATDLPLYREQWARVASLEILRSIWWGILRKPLSRKSWSRLSGAIYGFFLGIIAWREIPALPNLEG